MGVSSGVWGDSTDADRAQTRGDGKGRDVQDEKGEGVV